MNKNLYDWIFHFNPYEKIWSAVKRDNYNELFNNYKSNKVLKSKNINTLQEIINKTDGEKDKIEKILTK